MTNPSDDFNQSSATISLELSSTRSDILLVEDILAWNTSASGITVLHKKDGKPQKDLYDFTLDAFRGLKNHNIYQYSQEQAPQIADPKHMSLKDAYELLEFWRHCKTNPRTEMVFKPTLEA